MADLAGRLQIELRRTSDGLKAEIRSSRPVAASRVFVGKGVHETATGLSALFSVCSMAQAAACAEACEAAWGLSASPLTTRIRGLLVDAETVREHLWRVLLDWPGFLGAGPQGPVMARVMAVFARLRPALSGGATMLPCAPDPAPDIQASAACLDELSALSTAHLFGQAPDVWLERVASAAGLREWAGETDTIAAGLLREVDASGWKALGRSPVPPLPALSVAQLELLLGGDGRADAFVAAPIWEGAPAESSPYSRNRGWAAVGDLSGECGNGLLPRLAAQLVELATLLVDLGRGLGSLEPSTAEPAPAPVAGLPKGVGIARVRAARGLLVHRVELRGDRVSEYRILAPTEWNFHPRGAVASGLAAMPDVDDETLRRLAGLLVTAVDPCVDYDIEIA